MKQQKIIPKPKKFRFVKSHKKDKCPITNEIVEYWNCSKCDHHGDMSWVTKSEKEIVKFTTKCGFPLIWKIFKGWSEKPVYVGGEESGAMKKDEKTTEILGRRGKRNYEQNLEHVSRRGETDAGANRPEYIGKSKRDETLQTATAIQVDNTGEIRR